MTPAAGLGLAILRVTLGAIFLMHGYLGLAVVGPAGIGAYTTRMGYPPALGPALGWYLIVAHSLGGILLLLGLFTRWAALAQVPIMASAFFLHHLRQGFFLTGIVVDAAKGVAIAGGYEYTLLVLAATVTLVLAGSGAFALDHRAP
ncbi:MAG TPA: DoxX family protein [Methylomirabilota bacterium]|jgi:putative oxidoreductase|nr:DoxX family protein [Methylomirabilota bacterium]